MSQNSYPESNERSTPRDALSSANRNRNRHSIHLAAVAQSHANLNRAVGSIIPAMNLTADAAQGVKRKVEELRPQWIGVFEILDRGTVPLKEMGPLFSMVLAKVKSAAQHHAELHQRIQQARLEVDRHSFQTTFMPFYQHEHDHRLGLETLQFAERELEKHREEIRKKACPNKEATNDYSTLTKIRSSRKRPME
ncbi:MAG: hypothetical protein Q9190_003891 [Brigantiaea leucoxantha]